MGRHPEPFTDSGNILTAHDVSVARMEADLALGFWD
jgi:hypothetical protein